MAAEAICQPHGRTCWKRYASTSLNTSKGLTFTGRHLTVGRTLRTSSKPSSPTFPAGSRPRYSVPIVAGQGPERVVPQPRFGDLRRFCEIDGWSKDKGARGKTGDHDRYIKQLGDG